MMQYYAVFAACVALVGAQSTVPSGPPMGIYRTVASAPAATATTLAVKASSVAVNQKRDDVTTCLAQPTGIAHNSLPDTPDDFSVDSYYSSAALSAGKPAAYDSVYINNNASNNADQYMGYTLMDTYDVAGCASKCDAQTGCSSFNVYFERGPSADPNDASCLNPSSITHIKCVWWGSVLTSSTAVNDGQWRGQFHVLIAGSNAYSKIPVITGAVPLNNKIPVDASSSSSASSSSTATGFVTSTRSAPTSTATSAPLASAATGSAFYIQVGGSGSSLDTKYIVVSSKGAITYTTVKASGTTFTIDASGNLIAKSSGMALNLTYNTGVWQKIYFNTKSLQKQYSYASCSLVDPYVQCNVNNAFQFAGVCNNDGNLYFGTPERMPSVCKWAGLYPITA